MKNEENCFDMTYFMLCGFTIPIKNGFKRDGRNTIFSLSNMKNKFFIFLVIIQCDTYFLNNK